MRSTQQVDELGQGPVEYQELGQIDGKQYFIPWDWGFTSILYNTEQVDEVTSGMLCSIRSTRATSRCGMTARRR